MEETLYTALAGVGLSLLTYVSKPKTKGGWGIPPTVTLLVFSLCLSAIYTLVKLYFPKELTENAFNVFTQILGTANLLYLSIFKQIKKYGEK